MTKKVVLRSRKYYYTILDDVFQALGDGVKEFNWLIADYERNYYPHDILEQNRYHYVWLSYEELSELILGNDVQFIWGILLAFKKDIKKEDVLKFDLPSPHITIIDDNIIFQNPLSELEIMSWDSRELYIISKNDCYIDNFLEKFPEAEEQI